MIVTTLDDVMFRGHDVVCPKGGFVSYRFLLADAGMGFSVNKTMIPRGETQHWHYKNHVEACYCVSGLGLLKNLATGDYFYIRPDTMYALDMHDDHTFEAKTDVVLISIFNPPLKGNEIHGEDGSYE